MSSSAGSLTSDMISICTISVCLSHEFHLSADCPFMDACSPPLPLGLLLLIRYFEGLSDCFTVPVPSVLWVDISWEWVYFLLLRLNSGGRTLVITCRTAEASSVHVRGQTQLVFCRPESPPQLPKPRGDGCVFPLPGAWASEGVSVHTVLSPSRLCLGVCSPVVVAGGCLLKVLAAGSPVSLMQRGELLQGPRLPHSSRVLLCPCTSPSVRVFPAFLRGRTAIPVLVYDQGPRNGDGGFSSVLPRGFTQAPSSGWQPHSIGKCGAGRSHRAGGLPCSGGGSLAVQLSRRPGARGSLQLQPPSHPAQGCWGAQWGPVLAPWGWGSQGSTQLVNTRADIFTRSTALLSTPRSTRHSPRILSFLEPLGCPAALALLLCGLMLSSLFSPCQGGVAGLSSCLHPRQNWTCLPTTLPDTILCGFVKTPCYIYRPPSTQPYGWITVRLVHFLLLRIILLYCWVDSIPVWVKVLTWCGKGTQQAVRPQPPLQILPSPLRHKPLLLAPYVFLHCSFAQHKLIGIFLFPHLCYTKSDMLYKVLRFAS